MRQGPRERVAGVFSFIGASPRTDWLPEEIEMDDKGFVKTGTRVAESEKWSNKKRPPFFLETSGDGVFAAGDVLAIGRGGEGPHGVATCGYEWERGWTMGRRGWCVVGWVADGLRGTDDAGWDSCASLSTTSGVALDARTAVD